MTRTRLPNRRKGFRITIQPGPVQLSTGEYHDGQLGEIFLDAPKEGSFTRDILNAFAMSVSLGLQHGVPLSAFTHTFRNFKMEPDLVRQIFDELENHYKERI
jgi:ribonucleoside-diphosphate reductase alpha chain